jgi:hypothetical protein
MERAAPTQGDSPLRAQAGTVATFNANADTRLLRRFRDSPHESVTAMMQGHDVRIPQLSGKDVCLVWALKGSCTKNCKRKAQHKAYPRTTVTALHELMDTCGVAGDN